MKYIVVLTALALSLVSSAQTDRVRGHISTTDTADLTIYKVFPDSFPRVSVIFKAETRRGAPVWGLTKDKMQVSEDAQPCKVGSLKLISTNKPIDLGIVVDHSGSMLFDSAQLTHEQWKYLFSEYEAGRMPVFPVGYVTPMDNAKLAIENFVKSFNSNKDFVSFIGFSDYIDTRIKLTQDTSVVLNAIRTTTAYSGTALYDGIMLSLEYLRNSNGIRAVVVLTDGEDNKSNTKYEQVIEEAIKDSIPIYTVGLGDANKDSLSMMARSTGGYFYYSSSASSLKTIYDEISQSLQAYYEMKYESPNFLAVDSSRAIQVTFDNDTIAVNTTPYTASFSPERVAYENNKRNAVPVATSHKKPIVLPVPEEVVQYANDKKEESERIWDTTKEEGPELIPKFPESEGSNDYAMYGVGVAAVVLSAGTILFKMKKTKSKVNNRDNNSNPIIANMFPNPTNGPMTILYSGPAGQLQILSFNGQVVHSADISGTTKTDFGTLADGEYMAIVIANGVQSNVARFIVKK
jgi:Ca-activated chloride channel family protein